jgi:hypothetical protein
LVALAVGRDSRLPQGLSLATQSIVADVVCGAEPIRAPLAAVEELADALP